MALLVDGLKLPIDRWQIDEILDYRLKPIYNTKFEEFFVVTYGDKFHVGKVETKYGRIPVFFTPEHPPTSVHILNKKVFDYPSEAHTLSTSYDSNGDLVN